MQAEHNPAAMRATQDRSERELLSDVIQKIGNPPWDLLLVGDGSGTGWNQACGWACTLIEKQSNLRRFFYGGMDSGSINLAEVMPYLQGLTWYDANVGKERLQKLDYLRVVVLTDSQVTAHWGNQAMGSVDASVPRKQLGFYAAMRELRRVGYHCTFHWAPRMTTDLNWVADLMAGLTRQEVIRAANPTYVFGADHAVRAANAISNLVFHDPTTGARLTPYALNPTHPPT